MVQQFIFLIFILYFLTAHFVCSSKIWLDSGSYGMDLLMNWLAFPNASLARKWSWRLLVQLFCRALLNFMRTLVFLICVASASSQDVWVVHENSCCFCYFYVNFVFTFVTKIIVENILKPRVSKIIWKVLWIA